MVIEIGEVISCTIARYRSLSTNIICPHNIFFRRFSHHYKTYFSAFLMDSRVRKICSICKTKGNKPLTVGNEAGNSALAKNLLYHHVFNGIDIDLYEIGWSGYHDDHQSIADFFNKHQASFHPACRRRMQRKRETATAYAPIAAASQLNEEEVIQQVQALQDSLENSNDTAAAFNPIIAAEDEVEENNLADTPSTQASQWTPGKRLMENEDLLTTPKRPCNSRRVRLMRALLTEITKGGIHSRTQLFRLFNELVSSLISDKYKNEEFFLDEITFLSSMKMHIGAEIIIEHDGSWRYVMICSKQNLHSIMKQAFEKEQGSNSINFDLQHVRNSIVNCTSGGRFAGSFSEEIIEKVSAPLVLRETVSYLCYGVPDVESFDILSISNSIYFNHRKRPDVLKKVSYI